MYNLDKVKTTEQELEILELLSHGFKAMEIAKAMNLAEQTIKNKVQTICIKLDSSNRTEAVAKAIRLGIIQADSTGFSSTPTFSISIVTVSPGLIGGVLPEVPVQSISPGSSVAYLLIKLIDFAVENNISDE